MALSTDTIAHAVREVVSDPNNQAVSLQYGTGIRAFQSFSFAVGKVVGSRFKNGRCVYLLIQYKDGSQLQYTYVNEIPYYKVIT